MASRVEFAVSATPIYSYTPAGEGAAVDVIATDVGKTVGGNSSVTVTWGSTTGYSAGAPVYKQIDNPGTFTGTSAKFLWIKHTGHEFLSTSALGAATTETITLSINSVVVCVLGAGDSMYFPFATAQNFAFVTGFSGSNPIALEYFWTA